LLWTVNLSLKKNCSRRKPRRTYQPILSRRPVYRERPTYKTIVYGHSVPIRAYFSHENLKNDVTSFNPQQWRR
jgi:hypothetical protein